MLLTVLTSLCNLSREDGCFSILKTAMWTGSQSTETHSLWLSDVNYHFDLQAAVRQDEGEIPNLEGNQSCGVFLISSENMRLILGKWGASLKQKVTKPEKAV